MHRIIIRHQAGSRVSQVDEFPEGDHELIVGRDPAAHIRFDADLDDLVSRQHSKIIHDPWDPNAYQLVDLQSRNGTFLNQQRVYGAVRLNHNDVVQLGAGGPEFRFELDPPPALAGPMEAGAGVAGGPRPTRESWLPEPQGTTRPVGRGTVERMLGEVFTRTKKQASRSMLVGAAALLTMILVGGATWLYLRRSQSVLQSSFSAAQEKDQADLQRINEQLKANPEALNQAKEEVARLEKEMKRSNERNEAANKELLNELQAQRKQAAALARAIDQQKAAAQQAAASAPGGVAPPPSLFDGLVAQAQQKLDQGQASEALDLAQRLTQMDSSRWEGYALAAQSAAKLNDFKLAADMYERALARAPADARPNLEQQLKQAQQESAR
jgi:FHA domain-containing protein